VLHTSICESLKFVWWAKPTKDPPWRRDWRTSTTNDIVLSRSPATWTWKARHGTKIYEQWQGPNNIFLVNNLLKWDRGWWHKYT